MKQTIDQLIAALADYGMRTGLLEETDRNWAINSLLGFLNLDTISCQDKPPEMQLSEILDGMVEYGISHGLCKDTITERDLFDTGIMGLLTPRPSQVNHAFWSCFEDSPQKATEYFYTLSRQCNYIREERIAKDKRWFTATKYGDFEITINLSKPEKDPKAIAAARLKPSAGYPCCALCAENEGYRGRIDHAARGNLRMIDLPLCGEQWALQYSPYAYYREHCIVLNRTHKPMKIDKAAFEKLLEFVRLFPHYFVGSNADLPIVGGSILSHDHFQGGRYRFAMEKAAIELPICIEGYEEIKAGIVNWPMSVIRLSQGSPSRLAELADRILCRWREYTDEDAGILAYSDSTPHNTITPIARRTGDNFELDLVLRNNRTSEEHPFGIFHPHEELHHIKKENIGLIEVMGLAVLPPRLDVELKAVAQKLVSGEPLAEDPLTKAHANWAEEVAARHPELNEKTVESILEQEVGQVFATVLEQAGVFKTTPDGRRAFLKFIEMI